MSTENPTVAPPASLAMAHTHPAWASAAAPELCDPLTQGLINGTVEMPIGQKQAGPPNADNQGRREARNSKRDPVRERHGSAETR